MIGSKLTLVTAAAMTSLVPQVVQADPMMYFFFDIAPQLAFSPERLNARCPEIYTTIKECIHNKCSNFHEVCEKPNPPFYIAPDRSDEEPLSCGQLKDGYCTNFAPTNNCCLATECGAELHAASLCLSQVLHGLDRSYCGQPADCSTAELEANMVPPVAVVTPEEVPAVPVETPATPGEVPAVTPEVTTPGVTTPAVTPGTGTTTAAAVTPEGDVGGGEPITMSRADYNAMLNDMAVLTDLIKDMEIRLMKLSPPVE